METPVDEDGQKTIDVSNFYVEVVASESNSTNGNKEAPS
ncbi:hypothetical protein V3C99_018147 [Haemonchus contortus]|uniref:Nucleotide exchange factor GrpE n=1 Tax=Haemonchus contortus TaxID=6289 RepID=A0A7I4Z6H8_HAECO